MEKQLRNSKAIIFPLATVIVLIALSIGVANFLLGKINSMRAESASVQEKNEILSDRLSTLQSLEGQVVADVNVASIAIPPENPSIMTTNIIKNLASEHSVLITKFSVNSVQAAPVAPPSPDAVEVAVDVVNTYEINFEASAENYDSLASFVNALSTTRPLLTLVSLISEKPAGGEGIAAQVKLNTYSSPFPDELPALDEPLSGLSQEEQALLSVLESYTAPQINSDVPPTEVPPRENPFSLDI